MFEFQQIDDHWFYCLWTDGVSNNSWTLNEANAEWKLRCNHHETPPPTFLALAFLLQVSGLLLIPSVRWPLHGWIRGEAFYQRMPTSWWEKEIEES